MKQVVFYFAFIITLFFFSCKKDNVDNTVNPPVTIDSNYLSKVYIIDSTAAAEDTLETLSYYYDQSGRVMNVADSFIHSGVSVPFANTTYYYNGTDTIPYKHYRTFANGGSLDSTTKFFYYDAAGRRIKDSSYRSGSNSSGNYIRTSISTYQYVTGKIYGYSRDTALYPVSSFPASITIDTATLDANNYISSNIKHLGSGSIIQSVITNTNSKNIYYRLSIRSCHDIFPKGYATYNNFATSNNPSHITETWPGPSTDIFESENTFIFNGDGYVKQVTQADLSTPGQYYKSILLYKAL